MTTHYNLRSLPNRKAWSHSPSLGNETGPAPGLALVIFVASCDIQHLVGTTPQLCLHFHLTPAHMSVTFLKYGHQSVDNGVTFL